MSELSSDAKALIEQGRISSEPQPHDKARVRARLVSELGASAFAGIALAGSALSSTELGVASAKVVKGVAAGWLKGVVALSAVAGGSVALYVAQPGGAAHESVARVQAPMREQRAEYRAAEPAVMPAVTQLAAPSELAPAPGEDKREVATHVRKRAKEAARERVEQGDEGEATAAAAKALVEPATNGLSAELALLARAQRELREGRASAALALARRHAAEFPRGALGEERDGIETLARCMLGEADEAHARAFLARAPNSPLAARVRKQCGLE